MNGIIEGNNARTQASFHWSNRLGRAAWNLVCLLFFRFSPRSCHGWRAFLLRRFGARLGRNCHVYPKAVIWAPWNLHCGDEVGIGDHAILYTQAPIDLGSRVVVSQGAHLCTGTHDYESPGFELQAHPITVEPDAWLCAECFICPGVTIGRGAVIGARAVVTRSMPASMVCTGNPCRPIKVRQLFASNPSTTEAEAA